MVTGVIARDSTLSAAVIRNNADRLACGKEPASLNTAGFSNARMRLRTEVLQEAAMTVARDCESELAADPLWGDLMPRVIDGTTITANDTGANQEAFPQHGNQEEGAGFPIIRCVVIQSLATGAILDFAYGPFRGKETGEMALARQMMNTIKARDLLTGDRYFPSFFMMASLIVRGAHGLFQSHASRDIDFRVGKRLGERDHLVTWNKPPRPKWMTEEEYDQYPSSITIREVALNRKAEDGDEMILVTTLVDSSKFPKERLDKMYQRRWNIELALRDLKDTFGMGHVACNTPDMIEKVLWAHILAYNMIRWHILNAAILYEVHPSEVSVAMAARIITSNAGAILRARQRDIPALFAALYRQMIQVPVGRRPGRCEPRAVKRRPKPFPRLSIKRSDWRASTSP
jgi:hypothetical protein